MRSLKPQSLKWVLRDLYTSIVLPSYLNPMTSAGSSLPFLNKQMHDYPPNLSVDLYEWEYQSLPENVVVMRRSILVNRRTPCIVTNIESNVHVSI